MGSELKTILVIDDNDDIRKLLVMVLEKEGFRVLTGTDGSDGLEILNANKIDLIFLDVMMPKISGLELLAIIRDHKNSEINSVPVCMITAKSSVEDIDRALDLGATSYIVKPFRPASLVEKANSLLSASS